MIKFGNKSLITKYRVDEPNVFYYPTVGGSPFWKGVMWAAKAAKMGFQCHVGNGRKIKFWKDQRFGTSNFAIQYWDVYVLAQEQNISIADAGLVLGGVLTMI
jgi:hypothetical protein